MAYTIHHNAENEKDLYIFNTFKAFILKEYQVKDLTKRELIKANDHNIAQHVCTFMWAELSDKSRVWLQHMMEIRYNPKKLHFECMLQWIMIYDNKLEYEIARQRVVSTTPDDRKEFPPSMYN